MGRKRKGDPWLAEWESQVFASAVEEYVASREKRTVEFVPHPTLGPQFGSYKVIVERPPNYMLAVRAEDLVDEFPGRFNSYLKGRYPSYRRVPSIATRQALKKTATTHRKLRRVKSWRGRVRYTLPLKEVA
jgi:hypothetical protein